MRKRHPLLDAHEITPRLWQGSVPTPAVRASDFQVVVLCAREHQELGFSCGPAITILKAPNDDHHAYPFTREKLHLALKAARQVVAAIQQGKNCLVTCAAGMNRSGLVSALSLHLLYGWDGEQCIQTVRRRRGRHTRSGIQPLSNDDFTTALRRLKSGVGMHPEPAPDGWGWSESGLVVPL